MLVLIFCCKIFASNFFFNWSLLSKKLATLTKDRRESRLLWLEEKYGRVGEPGGDGPEPRHEFWFPGFVENRRKNANIEKEGALKTISFSGLTSVVHKALDELMVEESQDPLTCGNILRRHWSQLPSSVGGTQPKRRKIADKGNPSSKKAKQPKTTTAAKVPPASVEGLVPAAVDQDGEATGNGAQVPKSAATPTDGDNPPPPLPGLIL